VSPISRVWKKYGASLPWMLLRKLFGKFVRVETLVVYRRDLRQLPLPHANTSPAQFVCLNDSTSETLQSLCRKYPEKKCHERLRRPGQQCYVALRAGQGAGYAWLTRADIYVDEIACMYPISGDEIFIYDCFVDPACRGAGIYPELLRFMMRDSRIQNANLQEAAIAASVLNRASIRGISKAGFIEHKRIHYVECLQKQRWWGLHPAEA
jgi:GNAT superfamily N-acetyltransferase